MGEPTSDLQGITIDYTIMGEYLYIHCSDCKMIIESWESSVDLPEVIQVATEHKRADLEKGWVKTDG